MAKKMSAHKKVPPIVAKLQKIQNVLKEKHKSKESGGAVLYIQQNTYFIKSFLIKEGGQAISFIPNVFTSSKKWGKKLTRRGEAVTISINGILPSSINVEMLKKQYWNKETFRVRGQQF